VPRRPGDRPGLTRTRGNPLTSEPRTPVERGRGLLPDPAARIPLSGRRCPRSRCPDP